MRRYKISHFLSEALKGMFRNGLMSAVSVLILVSTLLVMGTFWLINENINYNLDALDDFREIVVFLKKDIDEATIENAKNKISTYVDISESSIEFISKEQALESEKESYGEKYAYIFDSYTPETNPLPDSFRFSYPETVEDIDYCVQLIEGIDGVESVRNRKDFADKIESLKSVISNISACLMAMLFIVSIFVIGNTVKLTHEARKDDIRIMRYMGATNFYISAPFILEGIIIGLFSGTAAYFIQKFVYIEVTSVITENYGTILKILPLDEKAVLPFGLSFDINCDMFILCSFLVIGFLTGILGTLTTRKHLKA